MENNELVGYCAAGASLIPVVQFVRSWLSERKDDAIIAGAIKRGSERMKFEKELCASWTGMSAGASQAGAAARYSQALTEIQGELDAALRDAAARRKPPPVWRQILLLSFPRDATSWAYLLVSLVAWVAGLYLLTVAPWMAGVTLGAFLAAYLAYVFHAVRGSKMRRGEWLLLMAFVGAALFPHWRIYHLVSTHRHQVELDYARAELAGHKRHIVAEPTGWPPRTPAETIAVNGLRAFAAHDGKAFLALAHPEFISRLRDLFVEKAGTDADDLAVFGVPNQNDLKALPAGFVVQVAIDSLESDRHPGSAGGSSLVASVLGGTTTDTHAVTLVRLQWSKGNTSTSRTIGVVSMFAKDQWLLWNCSGLDEIMQVDLERAALLQEMELRR